MKQVTDSSFDADVLKAEGAVLVDFWAEWCGPCRQIAPALEDLSKDLAAKVTVAKLNIDENPGTPTKYGVRGIPTLIIFKGGQVAATKIGALPKSKLYDWVESVVCPKGITCKGCVAPEITPILANRPGQAWPVFLSSKTDGTNIGLAAAEDTYDGVDRQYIH